MATSLNVEEVKPGDEMRVFCERHDPYQARYTNGRPMLDDRCPHCVIEELRGRSKSQGFSRYDYI